MLSISLILLCSPERSAALQIISTNQVVANRGYYLNVPPVENGSKPAEITVTVSPASGWEVTERHPNPPWQGTWMYRYDGNQPGHAFTTIFTGKVRRIGSGAGGVAEPEDFSVTSGVKFVETEYYIQPAPDHIICFGESATFTAHRVIDGVTQLENSKWKTNEVDHANANSITFGPDTPPGEYNITANSTDNEELSDWSKLIVVKVDSITPESTNVCYNSEQVFQIETYPEGHYDVVSVTGSNCTIMAYDTITGKVTVKFDEASISATDYKIITATCGTSSVSAQVLALKVEFKTYADDIAGPNRPHNLNKDTRQNEKGHYQPFKKCVARQWTSQMLDMAIYLDGYDDEDLREIFHEKLEWSVTGIGYNGAWQEDHELDLGRKPALSGMSKYNIKVSLQGCTNVCDRLIITVVSAEKLIEFNKWYNEEKDDPDWLAELPALYSSINVNADGTPVPPEPNLCNFWLPPEIYDNFYHPNAFFEMRSRETAGGHAHQAMYSEASNGVASLIREGISAGTADRASAFSWNQPKNPFPHYHADVRPFIWAAQLDGNPVIGVNNNRNLSDPIMHEGVYLKRYLKVRPPIANNNPELEPGNCPEGEE